MGFIMHVEVRCMAASALRTQREKWMHTIVRFLGYTLQGIP